MSLPVSPCGVLEPADFTMFNVGTTEMAVNVHPVCTTFLAYDGEHG